MDRFTEFTKEAIESMDGKTVPLVTYAGGPRRVIGEATLRADRKGLVADFQIDDERISKFLMENNI